MIAYRGIAAPVLAFAAGLGACRGVPTEAVAGGDAWGTASTSLPGTGTGADTGTDTGEIPDSAPDSGAPDSAVPTDSGGDSATDSAASEDTAGADTADYDLPTSCTPTADTGDVLDVGLETADAKLIAEEADDA